MMVVIAIPHITLDGSRTWKMVNSAKEQNVFSEIHLHIPRTIFIGLITHDRGEPFRVRDEATFSCLLIFFGVNFQTNFK